MFGTVARVFKTTNGGQSWNVKLTSLSSFESMSFINVETGWVIGGNTIFDTTESAACGIYKTTDGGNGWISQSDKIGNISSQYFINSGTGFIGDNIGHIYKTADGGNSWNLSLSFPIHYFLGGHAVGHSIESLFFSDNFTGWSGTNDTGIYKTTNQGTTWDYLNLGHLSTEDTDITDIYFINSNTGWIVGNLGYGIILKTTNGGYNWVNQLEPIPHTTVFNKVFFIDQNTGWAAGGSFFDNRNLYKTFDGGANWINISTATNMIITSIQFINSNTGWIGSTSLGFNAGLLKTTNGGINWNYLLDSIGIVCMDFLNESNGWIYEGISILNTSNAGVNWYLQTTDNSFSLENISILPDGTGYLTGNRGEILKTTNFGGPIGINETHHQIPKYFKLYQNYPNPFNPITKIKYELNSTAQIVIKVYDIFGKEVKTLVNQKRTPGLYEVEFNGSIYSSGIYFYVLQINNLIFETKKMVILK